MTQTFQQTREVPTRTENVEADAFAMPQVSPISRYEALAPVATQKITVIIPCRNEEVGIRTVIESFPRDTIRHHGYELDIIVVDNDSDDETGSIARSLGARVMHEPMRGKGNAIRLAFNHVPQDTDYVVMLDGDATYKTEEMLRLVELLDSGFCTVVLGSRLGGKIAPGAMNAFNRAGNWIYSHLIRQMYRVNVTDVLTGYFAWKREALERLRPHLESDGFGIEMEMVTKMARLGEEMYCVPISYHPRVGSSHLRPLRDGTRILWILFRNFFWTPVTKERPVWRSIEASR